MFIRQEWHSEKGFSVELDIEILSPGTQGTGTIKSWGSTKEEAKARMVLSLLDLRTNIDSNISELSKEEHDEHRIS